MKINIDKIKKEKTINELLEFSFINIDKPTGPTSFFVDDYVKSKLGMKTGHLGTLDPAVTGVLPVCLGKACKLAPYMNFDKTYVGIMRLHQDVSDKELKKVIKDFIGKIKQMPPKISAVKRKIREREIKKFNIIEREGKDVLFLADVEAGTYIRKLVHDIGIDVGGAHMLELRRIKAGIFSENKSVNLYDFDKAVDAWKKGDDKLLRDILIPGEVIADVLPVVQVKEEAIEKLLKGSPLFEKFVKDKKQEEKIAVFCKERFIGCYSVINKGDIYAMPELVN